MLGNNLRQLREDKGLTRIQLGEKAGLTERGIEYIEKEKRKAPRITTLEKLAAALDVTVNDLIK